MHPLSPEKLYYYHNLLTIIMVFFWITISYLGINIKNKNLITKISYCLIGFSVIQEILDYLNRLFIDESFTIPSLGVYVRIKNSLDPYLSEISFKYAKSGSPSISRVSDEASSLKFFE